MEPRLGSVILKVAKESSRWYLGKKLIGGSSVRMSIQSAILRVLYTMALSLRFAGSEILEAADNGKVIARGLVEPTQNHEGSTNWS